MKILRIERRNRRGVYHCATNLLAHSSSRFHYLDKENHEKWHPMPEDDPKLKESWSNWFTTDWHFGFKDIKQLEDWFPRGKWNGFIDWNQKIGSNDDELGISVYEIDEQFVRVGTKQLCFLSSQAKRTSFDPFESSNFIRKIINAITGQ